MTGWKTLVAGIGSILYGIGGLLAGHHDLNTAMNYAIAGMGVLGLGHKLDKQTQVLQGE